LPRLSTKIERMSTETVAGDHALEERAALDLVLFFTELSPMHFHFPRFAIGEASIRQL